jgi:agmatine deiminase
MGQNAGVIGPNHIAPEPPPPLDSTPRQDGFRMPAEFEPHAGCWMLWPTRPDLWRAGAVPAQQAFAAVAQTIARFEPVTMGVPPGHLESARRLLPEPVRLVEMAYDDAWMRDVGPTFVVNGQGEKRGVDWRFNAWGGLYNIWTADDTVAGQVLALAGAGRYRAGLVMEGGAFHTDGQETLLVTEECLLNPNRNPELSRAEIEAELGRYLNVSKIIWLGQGVFEDETGGHVDNLCCFVRPGVVALTWPDDPADPQYPISQAAWQILSRATDAQGRRLAVHKINQPAPLTITPAESRGIEHRTGSVLRPAQKRLAASYINHYLANGGVIVPTFDDPRDAAALAQLGRLYPEREVVGVYSREILLGGGNIHCITQQEPR